MTRQRLLLLLLVTGCAAGNALGPARNESSNYLPRWSPDGGEIAFYRRETAEQKWGIYTVELAGHRVRRLSPADADDRQPAWSPGGLHAINAPGFDSNQRWSRDGRQLLVDGHPDDVDETSRGGWELFLLAADGSRRTRITNNDVNDWAPDWAPDGMSIAFCSGRNDQYEIWTMGLDGSNLRRVTRLVYR